VVGEKFITVSGGCFGYRTSNKQTLLLKDVNVELHRGELTGVVGMNGAGKSTFLRSVAGLQPALGGVIELGGKPVDKLTAAELSEKVSVVLTERFGGFNLKVHDLVAMGQMPYTDSFHRLKEEHLRVIDRSMELAGTTAFKFQEVHELSDGMFQKALIAKALAQQTPAMLLDEPSAYLDYASKHKLFKLLKDLCEKESKCILVSSHDLDILLKYCDNLLIAADGGIEKVKVSQAMSNKWFIELGGGYI
jgi:iron complex transport system ATP-binding protein